MMSYHDKGAVKVETLSAALGNHQPRPPLAVLQHGADEQRQTEAGVDAEEEQLPTVVLPVRPRQVTRGMTLLLFHFRRFQPVSSTEGEEGKYRYRSTYTDPRLYV